MLTIHKLHLGDIGTFQRCKRKFFWEKIARIKPINSEKPKYLNDGTYGHLRLEEFHTGNSTSEQRKAFIEATAPIDGYSSINKLCDLYEERHQSDLKQFQVLSCEDSIRLPISNQLVAFTVDLKVVNTDSHKLEIIDHKFYKAGTKIDDGYLFCMNQPWSYPKLLSIAGQEIARFHLNVIFKRTLKFPEPLKSGKLSTAKTSLANVTEKDYRSALQATGQEITPEIAEVLNQLHETDSQSFLRFTVGRDKGREEWAYKELTDNIEEIEARGTEIENFPLNFGYGCEKCAFFLLCSSHIRGESDQRLKQIKGFEFEEKDNDER